MRKLFETTTNSENRYADVCGKNDCGEYVVRLLDLNFTKSRSRCTIGTYYDTDLESACSTAVAMIWGFNAARNMYYPRRAA